MSNIKVNTTTIRNCTTDLDNISKYYSGKISSFSGSYGTNQKVANYLFKIRQIYGDIASNITKTSEYLKNYCNDIEGIENQMSGGYGTVSVSEVSSVVGEYKNSITTYNLDDSNIFEITNYSASNTTSSTSTEEVIKTAAANYAVINLAFAEGVVNIAEMLVDGGAMLVGAVCSLVGADDAANSISDFVEDDWSKDLYHNVVNATGLDNYADPDSTVANIASTAGTVVGMVAISIATGGAASAAFGAGTAAAATTTTVVGAGVGALTNMGSEGENALKNGATMTEAEGVAAVAGVVGLVTGGVSGSLDAAASAAGAAAGKAGLGSICKYALASFGVGSSEPLINEMASTVIYRNDGENLIDSFKANAEEDGLLFQMALAGGMNSVGTLGNGLGGIKSYNALSEPIELENSTILSGEATAIEIGDATLNVPDEYIEETSLFSDNKKGFLSTFFNKETSISTPELTVEQQNYVNGINNLIKDNESAILTINSTSEISSEMLNQVDDLSKVQVRILGGFANDDGTIKLKYNSEKYMDRVTYTGYEALSITERLEELESMVDMSLSTSDRAKQIYDIISTEVPVMRDYNQYVDGHKVSASLRGLTDNNSVGKSGLVCAGYAQAYQELCTRCGIESKYIRGTAVADSISGATGAHAWNVVIDGDNYIPVDVTWKACTGENWFGASADFAARHFADADEVFSNYSNVISGSVSSASLDSIVSTMDQKYGKGSGLKALEKYLQTGDSNVITRTNNARSNLTNLSISDIENYVSSKANINNTIESIINTMDQKYGYGVGVRQLKAYTETGNYKLITSTNGARDSLSNLSINDIQNYLDNSYSGNYKYVMETELLEESSAANLFSKKISDSVGDSNKIGEIISEIESYTADNLPEGFDSLASFKKFAANELVSSGALATASGGNIYNMTTDHLLFKELVGESEINSYMTKNLENLSDLIAPTLSDLTVEERNILFDNDTMKQFFNDLSDESFLNIVNNFQSNNVFSSIENDTIRNRLFNLSSDNFDYFIRNSKWSMSDYIQNNRDAESTLLFANLILEKAQNADAKQLLWYKSMFPISDSSNNINDSLDEIVSSIKNLEETYTNNLKSKIVSSSAVSLNENAVFKGETSKYYNITYSIGDNSYTYVKKDYGSGIDFFDFIKNENLDSSVLSDDFKIAAIEENVAKNNLVLGKNSEISKGLNEVTMKINGEDKSFVIKNVFGTVDLNSKLEGDIASAEFVSSKSIPTRNFETNEKGIFEFKYKQNGVEQKTYLIPNRGKIDVDQYIIDNNLAGISDVEIKQATGVQEMLKNKLSIQNKFSESDEIFSNTKYGGNQSDVSYLVSNKLSGKEMSKIEEEKSEILINLIKKRFADATDEEVDNIASAYAKSGCCYMAIANATVSKYSSIENGRELFKNTFGFDLYESGTSKSFNSDALALDIYLDKINDELASDGITDVNVSKFLGVSSGVSGESGPRLIPGYFEKKGISVDFTYNSVEKTDAVSLNEALSHKILQTDAEYNIISSSGFDLQELNASDLALSSDGALQNASVEGNSYKNVGSHAMLITDVNEDGSFIVSSWSKKCEYIPNNGGRLAFFGLTFNGL
jgi:hypothetical protein